MLVDDLRGLVRGAAARDQVPAQPMVDISSGPDQAEEFAALVVDFAEAVAKAQASKARSLDIYADTLVLKAGATVRLADPLLRVTVIARRIVAGDGAQIILDHSFANPLIGLRILTGAVEGTMAICSERDKNSVAYDLSALSVQHAAPTFTNFVWHNATPNVGNSVVPPGLLARGEALHTTLAASFHFVAGQIAAREEDADALTLCHAMLRWIGSWAGLQSDLAQIGRLAEGLRAILPENKDGQLVRPIPPLTAATYLSLARARKDLFKAIELDARFLEQSTDMAEIARLYAKANLTRDDAEAKLIASNMATLESEINSTQDAIERAAKALRDRQLDQELDKIYLDRANAHDKIDKIVDASFQIAIGLVTLGISIAAICCGVPADPTASAKKDIQGVEGLIGAFKNTRKAAGANSGKAITELMNALRLFALPVTFTFKNAADHKDSVKALATSALEIMKAAKTIAKSGAPTAEITDLVKDLGDATRHLAASPSPLEARAAWDALEAEAINGLDVIINDGETAGSVKKAAVDYKTSIQKTAIYGRLMAEQQARKNAALRTLGTLALQKLAQSQKAEAYTTLAADLTDRQQLGSRIRALIAIRQNEAARAFFCACYGLRGAQYYETYTTPATLPALPHSAAELEALYSDFAGDLDTASGVHGKLMDFSRDIVIDGAFLLADFAAGKSVTITLPPDHPEFARLSRIRVTGFEIWLDAPRKPGDLVGVEIISATSFDDRDKGNVAHFTGDSRRIRFEYRGTQPQLSWTGTPDSVLPTPFAEWLLTLYTPQITAPPNALHLKLSGKALA